ncbi:DNA mismatch repair protein MSH2 [Apostasia shenzhenica]|uniref:DNA mismatch repair protein MSH2 n=1 Tax=Apostasia shenzhenica TaxID=1088818 RepID=A0A2I0BCK0_9ASPA|nr:DNA mismatch repair protein MSH2 [Apostasia shenzhenica]
MAATWRNVGSGRSPTAARLAVMAEAAGFLGGCDGKLTECMQGRMRTLALFNDYYTAHGENASFIAKTYYHTTSALRQIGNASDSLPSVSVSKHMFESIARDLLLERTDHTIEVYEGSGSNWRLTKSGTPGNIGSFEDILFANNDMQDAPVTIALFPNLRENQCTIGLSYVDMTNQKLGLAEFLDDGQFTNVESVIVSLGCKECLLPLESGKTSEFKNLLDMLSRCGVLLTQRKKTEFKSRDLVQDLGRLIRGSIEPVRELLSEFHHGLSALGALLSYAELLADDSNYGSYTIQKYCLDRYMRLDSAAMRALNILECKTDANKNFSLLGLMNRTCTAGMGKRLLNRWLKQPLLDLDEINCRLDLVQTFVDDVELRQTVRQLLKRIPDIERLTHNLRKKAANLSPVIKLYQACSRLPYIKCAIERCDGEFSPLIRMKYVGPLEKWLDRDHLNMFVDLVETAVDISHIDSGEYMISPGYDESLASLKNDLEAVEEQIHNLHKQTANDLDLTVDKLLKLEKGTQYGHVFRITKKEEQKIRKKLNTQFIVLETRKDGVKFTNAKLKKYGEQYQKIFKEYTSHQTKLVLRVVETAATFSMVFEDCARLLSEIDVLLCFAELSVNCPIPYVRPDITPSDEGDIILEGCRHPCVEAQDGVHFIPNDCKLIRSQSWFQIITGPNMGGKSTYIRQVGVNVLMAQIGCFVPCDRASVSIRDCIFARVGAGDCQLRGVSTFMQEMLETASILKGASEKSLIIIDELGRGTSTYDGFGLAWAICEHLVQVTRAPTLFATHFHELTALAHGNLDDSSKMAAIGVANYHVGAHIDSSSHKLTMLYKVEPGACDQSFGIHVAEFANFPESVVNLAKRKAAELEGSSETPLTSDDTNKEAEAKRRRACSTDETARGAARARQFLEEFARMPLDQMDVKQAMQHVSRLASDLENDAAQNAWLKQFFISS